VELFSQNSRKTLAPNILFGRNVEAWLSSTGASIYIAKWYLYERSDSLSETLKLYEHYREL